MPTIQELPSLIVLSGAEEGQVISHDKDNKPLSVTQAATVVFVPVVLVERCLVTPDYVLYMFDNNENIKEKLAEIEKSEQNAVILVGTGKERSVYFVENGRASFHPVTVSCGYSLDKISKLTRDENGKVDPVKNDPTILALVIRYLRLDGGHANEAQITGTRTGKNVFSTSFGPCNPIVGKRKDDQLFVLHHADGAFVDRTDGIGQFITSLEEGGGADFVVVMQNPKIARSIGKAPLLAGGLSVELQERNVKRVDFPEGYSAIACVNGTTVILAEKMEFFKNATEKRELIQKHQEHEIKGNGRQVDIRESAQIIPMSQTVKEVKEINQQMKTQRKTKEGPYENILKGLEKMGIVPEIPKKEGLLKKIFRF
ncbi:hypothetical protein [Legionella brunensis]|uniref:Uncharacterized protein n=1 Tax=Legionella brunensis TaxID=29422 RepID=A0A0W0SKF1_9GAMM|nr:hypothetical protein [Legionella brunensis]KTC83787.1 hypothetical protein Lbru_1610 [Legionella brunensis]